MKRQRIVTIILLSLLLAWVAYGIYVGDEDTTRSGRNGWTPPNTANGRGQPGVSPLPGKPCALATTNGDERIRDHEQGTDAVGSELSDERRDVSCAGDAVHYAQSGENGERGHSTLHGSRQGGPSDRADALIPSEVECPDPELRFADAVDWFWWRESRCGKDPRWKIWGKAGEEGQYRITPIFIIDVKRICGYEIDVFDNESCRQGITAWLTYWYPRVFRQYIESAGPPTVADVYELYRRGPKGYRKWRKGSERQGL